MVLNRQNKVRVELAPLETFLKKVRTVARIANREVTVCLVSDAEMARMNRAYRRKRGPTDVLSFPATATKRGTEREPQGFLGDIAIAPGTYREKLTVVSNGVHLHGTGKAASDVVLVYGDAAATAGGTFKSATLTASGDDFRLARLVRAHVAESVAQDARERETQRRGEVADFRLRLVDHVAAGFRVLPLQEPVSHRQDPSAHTIACIQNGHICAHREQIVSRGVEVEACIDWPAGGRSSLPVRTRAARTGPTTSASTGRRTDAASSAWSLPAGA